MDDTLDRADGVQQAMLAIGEHMRGLGHDVHYIVSDTKRTDIENIHSIGRSVSLQFNGNSVRTPRPVSKKKLTRLFVDTQFDVLHVQMPFSPFLAGEVLKLVPVSTKIVGTFHILPYNLVASTGTRLVGVGMKRYIRKIQTAYAVSPPALEFMRSAFGLDGAVLPNPVNYDFFHSFKRRPADKKRIVFVGRFEQRKGVMQLIKAYAALDESVRSQSTLTMIGKGPLLDDVTAYASEHSVSVDLPGFVTEAEKAQPLADADIAVFPSTNGESFGIVLAEAMAAGAGITIGGDNPGYSSVLGPWPRTLFDPDNTAAFTALLQDVIVGSRAYDAIGVQQHKAVKAYDIKKVAAQLLDSYTA